MIPGLLATPRPPLALVCRVVLKDNPAVRTPRQRVPATVAWAVPRTQVLVFKQAARGKSASQPIPAAKRISRAKPTVAVPTRWLPAACVFPREQRISPADLATRAILISNVLPSVAQTTFRSAASQRLMHAATEPVPPAKSAYPTRNAGPSQNAACPQVIPNSPARPVTPATIPT